MAGRDRVYQDRPIGTCGHSVADFQNGHELVQSGQREGEETVDIPIVEQGATMHDLTQLIAVLSTKRLWGGTGIQPFYLQIYAAVSRWPSCPPREWAGSVETSNRRASGYTWAQCRTVAAAPVVLPSPPCGGRQCYAAATAPNPPDSERPPRQYHPPPRTRFFHSRCRFPRTHPGRQRQ